jgi:hypothetical protein
MRATRRPGAILVALLAVAAAAVPATASGAGVKAGAAAVDASWHVGASAGQYASDPQIDPTERTLDPGAHATLRRGSYGVQSRLEARAIVIEGADGQRVAIVKNDLYIPQDLLWRRTALILESKGVGIGRGNLTMAVTHNHSSPFYSSTSPGAWTFQDVFDMRFFDYYAKRMAEAVEKAARNLKPVRVGASVSYLDKAHRHSFGPAIADDGSPAGYPNSDADHDLTVVRFDDISDPANPKPLANLVNWSLHPEMLDGNNLISADYLAPLERMVDRETGAVTIWTQNAVGTAEPERSTYRSVHEREEFTHREYAQSEYAARLIADAVVDTSQDVARGTPQAEYADRFVPFSTDMPVAVEDRFYPGPFSHPYPSAQNCRVDPALEGDPRLGGVPTCESPNSGIGELFGLAGVDAPPVPDVSGANPGLTVAQLGGFLPDNVSAPSYTVLEEDVSVHLQAIRLGDILFTVCSCEQWADQSRNIKSRTNERQNDEYAGYDWSKPQPGIRGDGRHAGCRENNDGTYAPDGTGSGTWTCPNPNANPTNPDAKPVLDKVTDAAYRRMVAQVNNPADGWNDLENFSSAENEPTDPREIKGNYSRGELTPTQGYRLTVPIGMANDYNGYIATYREYQRGDHYRKALTAWGPHSSDYMASRLVTLGGLLKDPGYALPRDQEQEQILQPKTDADVRNNDNRATALGEIGDRSIAAYEEALLRDDGGRAEAVKEPEDIRRFATAFFTFNGGNNFVDNPVVRVQREVDGRWVDYADQSGEVQTTLKFPQGPETASYLQGSYRWEWTAHFEAFISGFDTGARPRATPEGRYRFVVDGRRRESGEQVPYHLESRAFRVQPWDGITVPEIAARRDGSVSLSVGPTKTLEVPRVLEPKSPPPDCGTGDADACPARARAAQAPEGPKVTECRDVKKGEGTVAAVIGPIDYPDSYESPTAFVTTDRTVCRDPVAPNDPSRFEWFCLQCSFRPWLDAAPASCVEATVVRRNGAVDRVRAEGDGARFVADARLRSGEAAVVSRFGIRDANGERNGAPSGVVTSGKPSEAVLTRVRALAARELRCGQQAGVPGPFRARDDDDRRERRETTRRVADRSDAGSADDGGGDLPFTGLGLAAIVLAALALLAGGALLRRLGRDGE